MLKIVFYKQCIQTVSLLNDFVCVLLGTDDFDNICHNLYTCIYLYEYSYGYTGRCEMKNVSHTEYMNTRSLQCDFCCDWSTVILL